MGYFHLAQAPREPPGILSGLVLLANLGTARFGGHLGNTRRSHIPREKRPKMSHMAGNKVVPNLSTPLQSMALGIIKYT